MRPLRDRARSASREFATVAAFVAVVASARSSLADHYVVPTESMRPTVEAGDHVLVDKRAYGLRVPFSHVWWKGKSPAVGEVVVLESPTDGTVLLKRVVAKPGDRVAVKNGVVEIDGRPYPVDVRGDSAIESLPGKPHRIGFDDGGGPDFGPVTVPANEYFVLGDNRGNSRDGRMFGFVDRSAILGRAVAVCWRNGRATWETL